MANVGLHVRARKGDGGVLVIELAFSGKLSAAVLLALRASVFHSLLPPL